jgi:hypothetical protein
MVPDGSSEVELACNKKIIGFQQQGFYSSTEQYQYHIAVPWDREEALAQENDSTGTAHNL